MSDKVRFEVAFDQIRDVEALLRGLEYIALEIHEANNGISQIIDPRDSKRSNE